MTAQITTENLVKSYRGRMVVNHVSIQVKQGEVVGLLGPNGAGKTTTFYMVVGLIRPEEGSIYFNEDEITRLPMHKRSQRGIGYLPQEHSIFRKLTVEENILAIWEINHTLSKKERKDRLEQLLHDLGITHIRKSRGYQLSGGESRRVEIARALASNPSFILLDEPFAGIDPITVNDIQEIIKLLKQRGLGVLITDHNVRETLAITDHAYILHDGKILVAGTSQEISQDETARTYYLGEKFSL